MGFFTHINESFSCENCHKHVEPRSKSCRNHCPYCLYSKHVDVFPGDRAEMCGGLMQPRSYFVSGKKGLTLRFVCLKCGEERSNIAALENEIIADDYDLILKL